LFAGFAEAGDFIFFCLVIISNTRVLISSHEIGVGPIVIFLFSLTLYMMSAVAVAEIFTFDAQF